MTPSGQFLAALQTFSSTDEFENQIESLLRKWLEDKVLRGRTVRLAGRDQRLAVPRPCRLRRQTRRGVLRPQPRHRRGRSSGSRTRPRRARRSSSLNGASGSGKSSLARAGLIPRLTAPGVVPAVDHLARRRHAGRRSRRRSRAGAGAPPVRSRGGSRRRRSRPAAGTAGARRDRFPHARGSRRAAAPRRRDVATPDPRRARRDRARGARSAKGYRREVRADLLLLVDQLDDLFSADTAETRSAQPSSR